MRKGHCGLMPSLALVFMFIGITTAQTATYSFDSTTDEVDEQTGTIRLCMSRSGSVGSAVNVAVDFTTTSTTTINPAGTINTGDVTAIDAFFFPFGKAQSCQSIVIYDDSVVEDDETFIVTISITNEENDSNFVRGTQLAVIVTIEDDDGKYYWESPSYREDKSTGRVEVCMERTGTSARTIPVTYSGGNGGFTQVFLFSFGTSDTEECNYIEFDTDSDNDDDDEVFSIRIDLDADELDSPSVTEVTIVDDDDDETFYFEQPTYNVAESTGILNVCMRRDRTNGIPRTIQTTVVEISAELGSDFSFTTGSSSFIFSASNPLACNQIFIQSNDRVTAGDEATETFTLTIQRTGNNDILIGNPASTTVAIADSDVNVIESISWSQPSQSFSESEGRVTIYLSKTGNTRASSANFVVSPSGSNTARLGVDYSLISSSSVYFPVGITSQFIQLTLNDDTDDESIETITLELRSATNDVQISQPSRITISILDNDRPRPEDPDELSNAEIGGIVAGVIGLVLILALILMVLCCCMNGGSNPCQNLLNPRPQVPPQRPIIVQGATANNGLGTNSLILANNGLGTNGLIANNGLGTNGLIANNGLGTNSLVGLDAFNDNYGL